MKPIQSIRAAGFALALVSTSIRAETFPIFADTAGSPVTGKITKATNDARTLAISGKSTVFIDFAVANSGLTADKVTAARLTLYFVKVSKPGVLSFAKLTSAFDEGFTTATAGNPTTAVPFSTFPVGMADSRDFVIIDVTQQVKDWLNSPSSEHGIAISSDGVATVTLASKEGAASGHPAIIELDVNSSSGPVSATTIVTQSLQVAGNASLTTADNSGVSIDAGSSGTLGFIKKSGAAPMMAAASGRAIVFGQTNQNSVLSNIGTATLTEMMRISETGNVGIGTPSPTLGKLVVSGSPFADVNAFPSGRYISSTIDGTGNWNGGFVSIYATDNIVCTGLHHFSDARIKLAIGRSDSAADLETLRGIEITDYTHKDAIGKGSGQQKKVIAQQVEKIFPQAVTKDCGVIPDIYQKAEIEDGWVKLATDLKVGERVKLIGARTEEIHEVLEVRDDGFRTAFQPAGNQVFVFGREVKDFRAVDYDAISMLNVSATQELAKKLEAKDAEIAALRAANLALAERMADFDRQLAALKAGQEDRPARTVRASFDLK